MIFSLWVGFWASFSALFYVVQHPKLWRYIIVPLLFMCACVLGSILLLWYSSGAIHNWFLSFGFIESAEVSDSWFHKSKWYLFNYGSYVLIWLGGIVLSYGIGVVVAPLLSEPISDAVVLQEKWNETSEQSDASNRWYLQIIESICVSIVYFFCMIALLFLSLVPVLGLLSPVIAFFCTCLFLSKEIFDVPMAKHGFSMKKKISILQKNWGLYVGFGSAVFVMALIPLYNIFLFPVAVVGATRLWHQRLISEEI